MNKSYRNETEEAVEVTICSDEEHYDESKQHVKTHTEPDVWRPIVIAPGAVLNFDDEAINGIVIEAVLQEKRMVRYDREENQARPQD